ncbi:MAG: glutamine amidotransferase family protein [Dehalococcoidales bacterium]|nr:glutamine amidotransferase family protein [Dehalococcoidales bacterium]MDZ4230319.1 glutamine amidotransferase family protein [Dehalococcoidales bacterium]
MKDLRQVNNPNNDDKVIDACSIFGAMDTSGRRFSGEGVIRAIANMHDRGNGLGGGFAVYGIYPEYADLYALHIMFLSPQGKEETELCLERNFDIVHQEEIPTRPTPAIHNPPLVWRYFLNVNGDKPEGQSDDDYVMGRVMTINTRLNDSFVFSSGKDMGVFKGVGYPEEIADFFCLEQYEGYLWTTHGRFPTNTPGWWGGAHPFCILDWTVVHNGEISSYGINKRYLEQFGYHCTMQTDTEVVAYAVDLLIRKHNLPVEIAAKVLAPPLWEDIERRPAVEQDLLRALRQVYASLLLNGPFTIIIAHDGEMIGLTDRIRLRPLIVGEKGDMRYLSSEESAIRLICPDLEKAWIPKGGEPVISRLKEREKVPVPVASRRRTAEETVS